MKGNRKSTGEHLFQNGRFFQIWVENQGIAYALGYFELRGKNEKWKEDLMKK